MDQLEHLLDWFTANQRQLPWRESKDPYRIWVSEIMLQQTRVQAVMPYYTRWMNRFPTVNDLSTASMDEVNIYWQGLGYYQRAKNLLRAARLITQNSELSEPKWPNSSEEWQTLPGIGRYTANAIASIAHGEPVPVVDGNVKRVFARLTMCSLMDNQLENSAWDWAILNLRTENPGEWNQALMELGATVCTPKNPCCQECPLSPSCRAYNTGSQTLYPQKQPPLKFKDQQLTCFFHYHKVNESVYFLIHQFHGNEWWKGLWGLPYQELSDENDWHFQNKLTLVQENLTTFKHTVTNHHLQITPAILLYQDRPNHLQTDDHNLWINLEDIHNYAIPTAHQKAINTIKKYVTSSKSLSRSQLIET